jgi:anti-sigma regulatory factor (Ser/Thr protein kinase)
MQGEYRERFPNTLESASQARRKLIRYAKAHGFFGDQLTDLESAIGEALANAAEHGYRDGSGFDVRAYRDGDGLIFEIKDEGAGFAQWTETANRKPQSGSPRGFGIFLMHNLMDEIEYSEHGTRVRLKKRLPTAASGDGEATG